MVVSAVLSAVPVNGASHRGGAPRAAPRAWIGRTVGGQPVVRAQHWIQNSVAGSAHVVEKWSRDNKLLERTLNFQDRSEVSLDRDGDGHLDEWEFFSANLHVQLSVPLNGSFMLMDVEQERERDIVKLKLRRQPSGEYRVYAQYREPRKEMFLQGSSGLDDDVVAGECKESELGIQSNAININKALTDLSDKDVKTTISDGIMNESCKKEPFKNQVPAMAEGILTVFRSDKDFVAPIANYEDKNRPEVRARRAARAADRGKVTAGKEVPDHPAYLGCLRRYQLDTHASRIESALWEYQLSKHYYDWKIGCIASNDLPKETKCKTGDTKAKDGKCYLPKRGNAQKVGNFPLISFVKQGCSIDESLCDSTPGQFAKSFFHEMLHYSGIPDGPLAEAITDCCSQTSATDPSCAKLRNEVSIQRDSQRTWNHILSQASGNLGKLQTACKEVYDENCTAKGNEFVNLYARQRAQIKKDHPECRELDANGAEQASCQKLFQAARGRSLNAVFNDEECLVSRNLENLSEEAKKGKCVALRDSLHALLDTGEKTPGNNFCVKQKRQLGFFCPKPLLLFTPIQAFAEDDDFCESIAGIQNVKVDFSEKAYRATTVRKAEGVAADYVSARNEIDGAAGATGLQGPRPNVTGGSKVVGATSPSAVRKPEAHGEIGPPRPAYPSQPGKRAEAIAFDLRRQSDFANRVEQYTNLAFQQFVPTAKARAEGQQDPSFSLPDPLSREVSNVAGPSARRAMTTAESSTSRARMPASAKPDRENSAGENRKTVRTGTEGAEEPAKAAGGRSGGKGGPGGASGGGTEGGGKEKKAAPEDPTAREALIAFLLAIRDVAVLDVELKRASTLQLLEKHLVAVIDENGKRHPVESEAKYWLIYSQEKGHLTRMEEKR